MRIRHEKLKFVASLGWQYYVDTFFAILPTPLNTGSAMPEFAWLSRYWQTYPVDADGKVVEMYRVTRRTSPTK